MDCERVETSAGDGRRARESYDGLGGRLYDDRYRLEQAAKYDEILRHVEPSVEDIVLDDGCGTGLLMERLRSHAVGLDLSHGLLSTARARLVKGRPAFLIQADASMLPFRERVFDKAFAVTLIQNTPHPEHVLRELKRVSRPGSVVAVTALKKSFTPGDLKRLLSVSGLVESHLVLDEELKDWIAFAHPKQQCQKGE